jgi:hypothetical protein
MFIAGSGNDFLTPGSGRDIIAFNRGDGQDVINASSGADNTLSIGGGIRYADMSLTRTSNDLVLNLGGAGEKITFRDWYAGSLNRSFSNLQVIAEAMSDYNPGSTDTLLNRKIETFDFSGIAADFDRGGARANWALTNALLARHLGGSDSAAVGGDLAYGYGRTGSLSGIGYDAAQGLLSNAAFGASAQALQSRESLSAGVRQLS